MAIALLDRPYLPDPWHKDNSSAGLRIPLVVT